jgi:hypothetical protein
MPLCGKSGTTCITLRRYKGRCQLVDYLSDMERPARLDAFRIFKWALAFAIRGFGEWLIWSMPLLLANASLQFGFEFAIISKGGWLYLILRLPTLYLYSVVQVAVTRTVVLGEKNSQSFVTLLGSRRVWRSALAQILAALPLVLGLALAIVGMEAMEARLAVFLIPMPFFVYFIIRLIFVGVYPALDGPISLKSSWCGTRGYVVPLVLVFLLLSLVTVPVHFVAHALVPLVGSSANSDLFKIGEVVVSVLWDFATLILGCAAVAAAYRDIRRLE